MTGFQRLSVATCVSTYALLVLGGVVRATESGLACPDWPLCDGRIIPAAETHVLIEYAHRLAAAAVGILVAAMAVMAWRSYRHAPLVIVPLAAALVVLIAQIILGGVAVINELPSTVVIAHLGTALALLALLLVATVFAFSEERARQPASPVVRGFAGLSLFAALATFGVMLVGAYVSSSHASHASLACSGWPLCNGELIPDGGREVVIQFLHRLLVVALGLVILAVTAQAWRGQRHSRPLVLTAGAALALFVVQVFVGAGNVWSSLQPAVTAAHLAVGAALWSALVLLVVLSYFWARPAQAQPVREAATAGVKGLTP